MKRRVNAIDRMRGARTLDERVGISQGALQDIACDRRAACLHGQPIRAALGHLQQLAVSLGCPEVLRALGVFPGNPTKDGRLLVRLRSGQDRSEALPHGAATKLVQLDVEVAKARVELTVGPVCEVTQIAAFNTDIAVDDPMDLTASQLAHSTPLIGWNTRYIGGIIGKRFGAAEGGVLRPSRPRLRG